VLVSRELTNVEPGQQTVLDRLLDVLLVLALRSDFPSQRDRTPLVPGGLEYTIRAVTCFFP